MLTVSKASAVTVITNALEKQKVNGSQDIVGLDGVTVRLCVGLDGVAHFAGVNEGGPLCEMSDLDFERVINVNVTGVWRMEKVWT